ncbi:MAG: sigma-70 family RNA polymerase sigma factor [Gemmatimonadetes bacterium]|nr:sigma-70 family RNA polymerase sigma factor [Gemmatimonadota bacterium]
MPTDSDSRERDLVLRSKRGDRSAFGELVKNHMRRAYYVALGLVGSHDDALDISQEAFARAFDARDALDPERPFYPWLYQILRRLSFNHLRNRKTRRARLDAEAHWIVADATSRAAVDDPARQVERLEVRERIGTAIEELSQWEREVFVLRQFEDLRYREIAELLKIPVGTVMSRLYSARRSLAAQLEDLL